jgi:hypothetical protein
MSTCCINQRTHSKVLALETTKVATDGVEERAGDDAVFAADVGKLLLVAETHLLNHVAAEEVAGLVETVDLGSQQVDGSLGILGPVECVKNSVLVEVHKNLE